MFNILDYSAKPIEKGVSTKAIQKALDECFAAGGGKVLVPAGSYCTGTLRIKSGCTLYLESGAMLYGSTNWRDYEYSSREDLSSIDFAGAGVDGKRQLGDDEKRRLLALINIENAENCGIAGEGIIDGRGQYGKHIPFKDKPELPRPYLIIAYGSKNIFIKDVSLYNPGFWVFAGIECDGIKLTGLTVDSWDTLCGDGLDFDGSKNVIINDCYIRSGDDAISIKSFSNAPNLNYVISNCIISARWAAIRLGPDVMSETAYITVTNCVLRDCADGLKIQSCGGADFHDIRFSDIIMNNVHRPVFMTLSRFRLSRNNTSVRPYIGSINRIVFKDITAVVPNDGEKLLQNFFALHGVPEKSIGDITISGVAMEVQGGGNDEEANRAGVPEYIDYGQYYPEAIQLRGELPACGIYARHIDRLKIENCNIDVRERDMRSVMFMYDVKELIVKSCVSHGQTGDFIKQIYCPNIELQGCRINGEQIHEPGKTSKDMVDRMNSFNELTWKTHMLFEELSELTNDAEREGVLGEIPAEAWEGNGELLADAVVPYGTKYIHFPRLYGNMKLYIDKKNIGEIYIPELYRTAMIVSFKMPQRYWGKNVRLNIVWEDPSDKGGFEAKMPFGDDFVLMSVGLYSNVQFRG